MNTSISSTLLKTGSYINGQWQTSNAATIDVINPASNQLIAKVHDANAKDTINAVDAASTAMPLWRAKTAKERAAILHRWFGLIMSHQEELAVLLTAEQGKPLAEARGEIAYGASYIQWFAEEARRIYGDVIPHANSNSRIIVIKQAIGVVAAITPWNFPNAMITRKAAPALAAGCTFIVKAAAETPLSALAIAELAHQAGIPAGVFNVVIGSDAAGIGKVLTGDPRVAKFSFTGSTPVGKTLLAQCAATVKKASMELGGNAPFIVFDDADIDEAIKGLLISKYRNAGQTCVCANRILIQSGIYDEFSKRLVEAVAQFRMGDGSQEGIDIGPLITTKATQKVKDLVDDALAQGATSLYGDTNNPIDGQFYPPTILTNVTPDMAIASNEIFGPVAPLIKFDTEQEAIDIANDTNSGLASYMYTRDIGRVWRVSEALEYGMVGINEGIISNEAAPFGGIKESGIGREGSKYGIEDYVEIKYLCMGGIDQ